MLKLPKSLDQQFANRGYYGSVNHDAKAIYQRYLGFYSSNPADLYQLVPEEAAKKYVEYMGGISAIITKAREDFNKGNYRWVAQVMNQVVFAEPQNKEARELTADALEQLGYQTENATWRNEYLTGALELRNGIPNLPIPNLMSMETLKGLTWDMLFDYMGIRLNTDKAEGKSYSFNINIEGTSEKYLLTLENSVLIYTKGKQAEDADATIILTDKTPICEMLVGQSTLDDLVKNGKIKFSGSQEKLNDVFAMQDNFKTLFNIVTP